MLVPSTTQVYIWCLDSVYRIYTFVNRLGSEPPSCNSELVSVCEDMKYQKYMLKTFGESHALYNTKFPKYLASPPSKL